MTSPSSDGVTPRLPGQGQAPAGPAAPFVGISFNYLFGHEAHAPTPAGCYYLSNRYLRAVRHFGGAPLGLLPSSDPEAIERMLASVDGILLTGGWDMDPEVFGETPHPKAEGVSRERTLFELAITERALAIGMPILAICLGMQTVNVHFGGDIYQDLPSQRPGSLKHRDRGETRGLAHPVRIEPGTRLSRLVGRDEMMVNSVHHQAVRVIGEGLRVNAVSPDGVVEGFEMPGDDQYLMAVQWHPEELMTDPAQAVLFTSFFDECRAWRETRRPAPLAPQPQ